MHLRVEVRHDRGVIMICGYFEENSLKHVKYFLTTDSDKPDAASRTQITDIQYRGDECWNLKNIKKGKHILTVATDPLFPGHLASISHVITIE